MKTLLDGVYAFREAGGEIVMGSLIDRDKCPSCYCNNCFHDCDGSQGADENNSETEDEAVSRVKRNSFLDGVESLILALVSSGAIAGTEDKTVNEAIQHCLDMAEKL
jgi:hypothetical protein